MQTELHYVPLNLKLAKLGPEARLLAVRGPHPQLMVATGQIELGEEVQAARAVEQRGSTALRDGVEAPVVVADAPRPVQLACEHHRRSVPCGRVLNPAAVEQVDELCTKLRELAVRELLHWPRPLHRCIAHLELELHGIPCWAPPSTSAYCTFSGMNAE